MAGALPDVLLTYGWCRVSYVILHSLAARGVRVHVADASRLAMCRHSRKAASFTTCRGPFADPDGYVQDVARAVERTGARVLLPGHEDIVTIARHREALPAGTLLPAAEGALLARLTNKLEATMLAQRAGVPVPETFKPATRDEVVARAERMDYPAVVKTQIGNSAKGVRIARDAFECVAHFDELVASYRLPPERWPIVQSFVPGTGYGVCVLYRHGQLRAAFSERYVRCKDGTLGTSVYRESVERPDLVAHATALLDSLRWHGVAHLDFLHDEATGRTALIEVNPRFWGALDLAVRAGVDFPWLLYRMAVDGDVEPVTRYRVGVRSRWILGEMLHALNRVRRRQVGGALRWAGAMLAQRADSHDDFRASDPIPLGAEFLYYATRFLATGSTNPVEEGMIG